MTKVILLFCLLCFLGCGTTPRISIQPRDYTQINAKELLLRASEGGRKTLDQIDSFRAQVMALSMPLILTTLGFILTRKANEGLKAILMLGVAGFCFMMYTLDIHEQDLSRRQGSRCAEVENALLHLDQMYENQRTQLDTVLMHTRYIEGSNRWEKLGLFFSFPALAAVWYGTPFLLSIFFFFLYWYSAKKKNIKMSIHKLLQIEES
jgi:hypothetical protein